MPRFGKRSRHELSSCDEDLKIVCNEAIKIMDFAVLEGQRGEFLQNSAFSKGLSKLKYPKSKHNKNPSLAVDLAPYPIDWNDLDRFILLAGIIKGIAHSKGIEIIWGGDWNNNNILKDNKFMDYPHFEIRRRK